MSVLLPYRDEESTIEEAVRSVLDQDGVDLEVLAVDDGSSDAGPQEVQRLAREDARLRPLSSGGMGIVGALTVAAKAADGRYLARMDGDDVSIGGRLAAQRDALVSCPELGAVGTRVECFPDAGVGEGLRRYVTWQNTLVTAADHARDIFVEAPLCHPSVMLRREAFESVGGYRDTAWAEDYDLWLRLVSAGYGLAKVPTVLLRWRHHPRRLTLLDPRYAQERFVEAKAHYLAPWVAAKARPLTIWGAGPTGKRLARALEPRGSRAARFVDIDPRKIGGRARGVPIVSKEALRLGAETVLVAVGSRGARGLIRKELEERGFVEGEDFRCTA